MAADISSLVVGASSFIARVCKDLRIAETINRVVEWDENQCKVSPGTRIASLVVNMLVERRPLYRVSEFYESMDLPVLFQEEGLVASDLNDDALGRALDSLYEAGPKHCFQSIACGAVSRGYLQVKSVHADTTSVSLWGEYEPTQGDMRFAESNPDRPLIDITHGYSKQHRPDLKQFVYGLVVSAEGVPLLGDVNDGNTSDKTWNQRTIEEIKTSILDP
jgi:transposase